MSKPKFSTIGDYTIEKTINTSGMSSIHVGYIPPQNQYKVAIKLHLDSETEHNVFQEFLRKEAEYLALFRHPNVIRIFPTLVNAGRTGYCVRATNLPDSPWYFAMEYLPSGDLTQHLKKIKTFPILWIVEFFYQLLITVQFLHHMGYGHCDLKPDNILLREIPDPNKAPHPILTDFGTTHPIGTPIAHPAKSLRYSPPEILLSHTRQDIRPEELNLYPDKIDIWSLGAILFELLTGRPLFNQKNDRAITTSILEGKIDFVRSLRPEVHESLDIVLAQMLKRAPEERPEIDDLVMVFEERISSVRPPRIPLP